MVQFFRYKALFNENETDAYIHKDYVLQLLEDHCANKADNSRKIWTVLILQEAEARNLYGYMRLSRSL